MQGLPPFFSSFILRLRRGAEDVGMAGKLRLEFHGTFYHVINRGNYRAPRHLSRRIGPASVGVDESGGDRGRAWAAERKTQRFRRWRQ